MAFASLTIDLEARLANIEKDLGKSVQMAEKSAQRMQAAFSGIGRGLAFLGVAGAGGGLVNLIKSSLDAADNLSKLATKTGTSVEALASLELAAKTSDTSVEALSDGMGKLSVFMARYPDQAKAIGLTAKDPAQAMAQLADALVGVEDPSQRNALAMEVLGKSYRELLPLLAQGGDELRRQAGESADYAARMADLSEKAVRFNDALATIGFHAGAALLPLAQAFADMADAALQAAEGFDGLDAALAGLSQFGTVGQTLAVLWANVSYVFKGVGNEIGGIAAQIGALLSGDFKGAGAIGDAMKEDAAKARAELDKLEQRILNFKPKPREPIKLLDKNALDPTDIITDGAADKVQATLRKAFDTKALDDFLGTFKDRRAKIEQEYAGIIGRLTGSATAGVEGAKGFDLSAEILKGRGALASGDQAGADQSVARARQMLENLKSNGGADFEVRYYGEQLKQFELGIVNVQEKAATGARDAMLKNLEAAREEIAKMDPLKIPLASDAVGEDLKRTIEQVRKDLQANPLQIPVVATRASGIYEPSGGAASELRSAALQVGGR